MTALLGKTVVCTGVPALDTPLADLLSNHGATVVHYPCIAITPPEDLTALDTELAKAATGAYTWIVFTSTNTVDQVLARLDATGLEFPMARIAAVGPTTAQRIPPPHPQPLSTGETGFQGKTRTGGEGSRALAEDIPSPLGRGVGGEGSGTNLPLSMLHTPAPETTSGMERGPGGEVVRATEPFLPTTYTAATLAAELPINPGETVLIPQADIALPTLANGLRARGAIVTTVTAYRTTSGSGGVDLPTLLIQGQVDAILFASPSAVTGCQDRFHKEGGDFSLLNTIPVVCIGPVTAAAARDLGLTHIVTAPEHTRSGMANALLAEFAAHREETHA